MPREFFRHDHDTPNHAGPQVTVGWDRAPGVQIATVHNNVEVIDWMAEALAEVDITEDQRSAVIDALTQQESPAFGWFVTLGRQELNRLVRTLRKGRDAAFGADA